VTTDGTDGKRGPEETADEKYETRAVERLIFFSDAVAAIAITLLAIDLPVPAGATTAKFWSSVRENEGVYLAFLVSFIAIAVAWSHHHDVFKYVRRTDGLLRRLNMLWLLMIILIPFATKLLTGFSHHALDVHALRFGFYALLQTVAAAALLAISRHLASASLQAPGRQAPGRPPASSGWQSYGTMLGFGLSIPVFFATTYAWILWWAVPVLIDRLDRIRRGRGPVTGSGPSIG
jgi:uncharacterized membrane protein